MREIKVGQLMWFVIGQAHVAENGAPAPIRDRPNPDGAQPWGRQVPDGLGAEGPTDRVLRWVAHVYKLALALENEPTKAVEVAFGVSRPTAGRWVAAARAPERGYLGPAEIGKAG
jgi:hypothetical protein